MNVAPTETKTVIQFYTISKLNVMFYTVVTVSAVSKEELMYLTLYLCVMIDVKLPLWKANSTSQRKHIVVVFFQEFNTSFLILQDLPVAYFASVNTPHTA